MSGTVSPLRKPAGGADYFPEEKIDRDAPITTAVVPTVSAVWPILTYCGASILMTVVNKFVVSGRAFNMNFLLLAIQFVVCTVVVVVCKRMGLITVRNFDKTDAIAWFPISFCLVIVIYTGSKSLQHLTIPVYTIFKNLTIILIAYGEVYYFAGHVTVLTLYSFGLMVLSSIIAAWGDIVSYLGFGAIDVATNLKVSQVVSSSSSSSQIGYFWMALNCVSSAAYVIAMRKRIKITNFKDWDTMFYNNLLAIPVLIVFSFLVETWTYSNLALNFPASSRTLLISAIAFSGGAAVFISYSSAWCLRICGPTAYSMVGALNKLPVATSGMLFFGDPVTFTSVSAIFTGFMAGVVYALAKINQKKQEKVLASAVEVLPLRNNLAK